MGAQKPSRPTGDTGAYEDACQVTPGEPRVRRKRVYAIVEQPVQVQEGDQTKDRAREDEVGLHLLSCPPSIDGLDRASVRRSRAPGRYSRIGITTYFVCRAPGAWIRQLLFESVSPISTLSLSIAPSASRR